MVMVACGGSWNTFMQQWSVEFLSTRELFIGLFFEFVYPLRVSCVLCFCFACFEKSFLLYVLYIIHSRFVVCAFYNSPFSISLSLSLSLSLSFFHVLSASFHLLASNLYFCLFVCVCETQRVGCTHFANNSNTKKHTITSKGYYTIGKIWGQPPVQITFLEQSWISWDPKYIASSALCAWASANQVLAHSCSRRRRCW